MTINHNYDETPEQPLDYEIIEPYYDVGGIKSMDIIRAKLPKHFTNFQAGLYWNILKYALRCPYKGQLHKDLDKLIDYAQRLKEETNMHTIKRTNLASKISNPHLETPKKRINRGECYLTECRFHSKVEPICGGFPENSPEALCLRPE